MIAARAVGPSSHGAWKRKWSLAETAAKPQSRAASTAPREPRERLPLVAELHERQMKGEFQSGADPLTERPARGETRGIVWPRGRSRHPLRAQRRAADRLPGGRRGPARHRAGPVVPVEHRDVLGDAVLRALLRAALVVLAADPVRPARERDVRRDRRCDAAGGADRRRPGRDRRGRLRAAGADLTLEGCGLAALFAASHPDAGAGARPVSPQPRLVAGPGYEWAPSVEQRAAFVADDRRAPGAPTRREPVGRPRRARRRAAAAPDGAHPAACDEPCRRCRVAGDDRRDRRARRASQRAVPDAGAAPRARHVPRRAPLALCRRAHPGRPLRRSSRRRAALGRRRGRRRRRDPALPDRGAAPGRQRPRARDGAVHRHRRLDRARRRARRRRWRVAAGAPRRASCARRSSATAGAS